MVYTKDARARSFSSYISGMDRCTNRYLMLIRDWIYLSYSITDVDVLSKLQAMDRLQDIWSRHLEYCKVPRAMPTVSSEYQSWNVRSDLYPQFVVKDFRD